MKKLSIKLWVCVISAILAGVMLTSYGIVLADTDYEARFGISYEDLFLKYPQYLDNDDALAALDAAAAAYMPSVLEYDSNGALESALDASNASAAVSAIRDIGSARGLDGSFYDIATKQTAVSVIKSVCADADSIAKIREVRLNTRDLSWIGNISDASTGSISTVASHMININASQAENIIKNIVNNKSGIFGASYTDAEIVQSAVVVCVIVDTQLEVVDYLINEYSSISMLKSGLQNVRSDMASGIESYVIKEFVTNRGAKAVADEIKTYSGFGEINGVDFISRNTAKSAMWLDYDALFPHNAPDSATEAMLLASYIMETDKEITAQRTEIDGVFYMSDVENYEKMYELRLKLMNLVLDKTNQTAAKTALNGILPDYAAYMELCFGEFANTPESERRERIVAESEVVNIPSGMTIIIGNVTDDDTYNERLCITSGGYSIWKININGGTLDLRDTLNVNEFSVTNGTLKVSGTLNVEYGMNISDRGTVTMQGGRINVKENFTNTGTLNMTNDGDYICVEGDFSDYHGNDNDYDNMTAGTMEIKGNMVDCGQYRPKGTHKTILSGTKPQSIDMRYDRHPYPTGYFNNLEILNTSAQGITIEYGETNIKGEIYSNGCPIENPANIRFCADAEPRGNVWDYDVMLSGWNGDETVTFNGNVIINGTVTLTANQEINGNLTVDGSNVLDVNCDVLDISGDLSQSGTVNMNGNRINIGGNYTNTGKLNMTNDSDYICVEGDFSDYHGNDNDYDNMTAGTMEIKGDMVDCGQYRPKGTHKTILSGTSPQSIDMRYDRHPYPTGYFNNLEILNTSAQGITIEYGETNINGEIYSNGCPIENPANIRFCADARPRNNEWDYDVTLSGWNGDDTVTFNGNVIVNGTVTLTANQKINGNLTVDYANVLNISCGALDVRGDVSQSSTIQMNSGRMNIYGNYTNTGKLNMTNDSDYICVEGDFSDYHGNDNDHDNMTAGTMEIKGNMVDCGQYRPKGTHKTILSGTNPQSIDMNYDRYPYPTGYFNNLEILNTSAQGITIEYGETNVNGEIYSNGCPIENPSSIRLCKDSKPRGNRWDYDVTLSDWNGDKIVTFNGNVTTTGTSDFDTTQRFNSDLTLNGTNNFNIRQSIGGNLTVNSSTTLNLNCKTLDITGDLMQKNSSNAIIQMNGTRINVGGNYINQGALRMNSDSDYICVKGDFADHHDNGSEYDNITAGTMEIKGNMVDCGHYRPKGTHKTILSGTSPQSIDMNYGKYPYPTGYFNNLEILNTSAQGITIEYGETNVNGEIYSNGCPIENPTYLRLYADAKPRGNVWDYDVTLLDWNGSEITTFNGTVYPIGNTTFTANQKIKNLAVNSGTLNVKCNLLDISGDLSHSATVQMNGTRINIGGNYTNTGTLNMTDDFDYICVEGDFVDHHDNGSEYDNITAGTMEIKGNMIDCGQYRPKGTHKTILSGTKPQSIDMNYGKYPYPTGYFNNLEIANTSVAGISIDYNPTNVNGEIRQPVGTAIENKNRVMLRSQTAFVDYGSQNAAINAYVGNAADVTPTWLDYETYISRDVSNTKITSVIVGGVEADSVGSDSYSAAMPYGSTVTASDIKVVTDDSAASYTVRAASEKDKWIITVTAANGSDKKSYNLTVTYSELKEVIGIYMEETEIELYAGKKQKLNVLFNPSDATYKAITWQTSNENVASVTDGTVTAVGNGTATITATSHNGHETSCTVRVITPSESIRLNKTAVKLQPTNTVQLSALITPANSTDEVTWSSSNISVAIVTKDGLVTARAAGTAVITATTESGLSAECNITVQERVIPVTGVDIAENEIILAVDDAKRLSAGVIPEDAEDQSLTWSSSDENVCVVSTKGVVTATGGGTAIVTATSANGYSDKCVVKVVSATETAVVLNSTGVSVGGEAHIKANIVKNPGISAYRFTIVYDEAVLTPVAVTPNSGFGGTLTSNIDDNHRDALTVVWYSDEDVELNGELFDVEFRADDYVEYGDTTEVSIEYDGTDICNTSGEFIALYTESALVTVIDPLAGDIYEDGEINVYDLTLAARYVTGIEALNSRQIMAGDVNYDGSADIKDVVLTAQYLAGGNIRLASVRDASEPVVLTVGDVVSGDNNTAEIPVYIENNSGIAGFTLGIDYDETALEIVEITPANDAIRGNLQTNLNREGDNSLIVSWYNTDDINVDGALFNISVRYIGDSAEFKTPVSISDRSIICNSNAEDVVYYADNGSVRSGGDMIEADIDGDMLNVNVNAGERNDGEQAQVIAAFYNDDGSLAECAAEGVVLKKEGNFVSFNISDVEYDYYKVFVWNSLGKMVPIQ